MLAEAYIVYFNFNLYTKISLTLNPDPAAPNSQVIAEFSGLDPNTCYGKNVYIRNDSCSGTLKCSFQLTDAGGGSCNFNGGGSCSPLSQPTYYACIDKNNDKDYYDSGEVDYEVLNMICCQSDADCSSLNCGNYSAYCNATTYTCTCRTSCTSTASHCADGYCCTDDPSGPLTGEWKCVGKGIYSANPKYLCDPPEWSGVESPEVSKEIKPTILDLILNFFQNIFLASSFK